MLSASRRPRAWNRLLQSSRSERKDEVKGQCVPKGGDDEHTHKTSADTVRVRKRANGGREGARAGARAGAGARRGGPARRRGLTFHAGLINWWLC